jgi:hypothetical protein
MTVDTNSRTYIEQAFNLWRDSIGQCTTTFAPLLLLLDEDDPAGADDVFRRHVLVQAIGLAPNAFLDATDKYALMAAFMANARWRDCLLPGGAPHGLASMLIWQMKSMDRSSEGEDRMTDTINLAQQWIGGERLDPWRNPNKAIEVFSRALFGDWWWDLRQPQYDTELDVHHIVANERPPFLPSMLPEVSPVDLSQPLPELLSIEQDGHTEASF